MYVLYYMTTTARLRCDVMSTTVDQRKAVTRYGSVNHAREKFSDMLSAAEAGNVVVVTRKGKDSALIEAGRLRWMLNRIIRPHQAQVVRENGKWTAYLPGLPIAVEEAEFDIAISLLIESMREYVADWQDHLYGAVNHRNNWEFVQFVELSTDEQLKEWLVIAEQ